jgi:hypothetical protein
LPTFSKNESGQPVQLPAAGLPDGLYSNQNRKMSKFWGALEWKILVYFMTIWNILLPFGIMYGHLVQFVVIWYIFPQFSMFGPRKNLATLSSSKNDGLTGWSAADNHSRIRLFCSRFSKWSKPFFTFS